MIESEPSGVCRLFDVPFVKHLLWHQDTLPSWVLWLIWWSLPWARLAWIQEVAGQMLVQVSDGKTGEVLGYQWYATGDYNAAAVHAGREAFRFTMLGETL